MARKITLTVPDALYKKINEWRSAFNMSRIFQDAVSEAIRRKEDFHRRLEEESGLSEIVQRLRQEKSNWEKTLFYRAVTEGQHWAASAHYEDLLLAVSITPDQILTQPDLEKQLRLTWKNMANIPLAESAEPEVFQKTVLAGWKKGVSDFWEMVQDKI